MDFLKLSWFPTARQAYIVPASSRQSQFVIFPLPSRFEGTQFHRHFNFRSLLLLSSSRCFSLSCSYTIFSSLKSVLPARQSSFCLSILGFSLLLALIVSVDCYLPYFNP
jgi:hypothetical protein